MKLALAILVAASSFAVGQTVDTAPRKLAPFTVGTLPAAASWTNAVVIVTDGNAAGDCTVGGGTTRVTCASNGSAWASTGGSGSASIVIGSTTISGGTSTRILYNNSGIAGEYAIAAGIAAFLASPTSANLLATMTTKTGTGLAVFNDTPTFISPVLGNASATSLTIDGGPACTKGTGAVDCSSEGTAPSVGPAAGVDTCYNDSTLHAKTCSYNNGSYFPLGRIIAHGSKALDFASTATGACATVITDTATGAVSTDVVLFNANASIKAVTGFVPASTGGFSVAAFPSADLVSFEACNWTAGTVDPGSFTANWMIIRI